MTRILALFKVICEEKSLSQAKKFWLLVLSFMEFIFLYFVCLSYFIFCFKDT